MTLTKPIADWRRDSYQSKAHSIMVRVRTATSSPHITWVDPGKVYYLARCGVWIHGNAGTHENLADRCIRCAKAFKKLEDAYEALLPPDAGEKQP